MANTANMTAPMIPIYIERQDPTQSWGFRLQGGSDYRLSLSVKKVVPNSPAYNRLHPGDVIVAIQGQDATSLSHQQSHDLIKDSGNSLNLMVRK
jgi:C-terminal processing protease CtpA/Prc